MRKKRLMKVSIHAGQKVRRVEKLIQATTGRAVKRRQRKVGPSPELDLLAARWCARDESERPVDRPHPADQSGE